MVLYLSFVLESMDVVGRIPHPNLTQPDTVSNAVARVSVPCLSFFFSRIRTNSAQFAPNRADSARFGPRRSRFWPRRPESRSATWRDAARCGMDARSAVSLRRRHVGRGCAGLGAASVHPCFSAGNKNVVKASY